MFPFQLTNPQVVSKKIIVRADPLRLMGLKLFISIIFNGSTMSTINKAIAPSSLFPLLSPSSKPNLNNALDCPYATFQGLPLFIYFMRFLSNPSVCLGLYCFTLSWPHHLPLLEFHLNKIKFSSQRGLFVL